MAAGRAQHGCERRLNAARPAPFAEARDLVRYATLAVYGLNTQPWRFRESPEGIDVLPDLTRCILFVDPGDHHLFTSLGYAAENLDLALAARDRGGHCLRPVSAVALNMLFARSRPTLGIFDMTVLRCGSSQTQLGTPMPSGVAITSSELCGMDRPAHALDYFLGSDLPS